MTPINKNILLINVKLYKLNINFFNMEKNIGYHLKHPIKTSNKLMNNNLFKAALISTIIYSTVTEVSDLYSSFASNDKIIEDITRGSFDGLESKLNY